MGSSLVEVVGVGAHQCSFEPFESFRHGDIKVIRLHEFDHVVYEWVDGWVFRLIRTSVGSTELIRHQANTQAYASFAANERVGAESFTLYFRKGAL